jgi:hypothetical protein
MLRSSEFKKEGGGGGGGGAPSRAGADAREGQQSPAKKRMTENAKDLIAIKW